MTTANARQSHRFMGAFGEVRVHMLDSEYSETVALIPIARGLQLLHEWGKAPNESFNSHIDGWLSWSPQPEGFPPTWKAYIEAWFAKGWPKKMTSPLLNLKKRQHRVPDEGEKLLKRLAREACPYPLPE